MYHKTLAECFPYDELPLLYECANRHCFYHETLMKITETSHKTEWCPLAEDVLDFPACPSCGRVLDEYEDPDGKTKAYV